MTSEAVDRERHRAGTPPGSTKDICHSTTKARTITPGKDYYRVLSPRRRRDTSSLGANPRVSG